MTLADAPEVLTVPEVAEILRVSRDKVYRLVVEGVLRSVPNMGRRTLITRRTLEQFLDAA